MKVTIELNQIELNWLEERTLIQFRPSRITENSPGFPGKSILDKVHAAAYPPPKEEIDGQLQITESAR